MKLHSEDYASNNVINSYKEGSISINGILYTDNVLFSNDSKILKWDIKNVFDLDDKTLIGMLESFQDCYIRPQQSIEFVLIGAGNSYTSIGNSVTKNILNLSIGVGIEIMKTSSAIYTYNAMLMQDRQVLTALIIRN